MSLTMLSASLPSLEACDAFSLSPINVVARVLASHRTSVSRISRAPAAAVFAAWSATWVVKLGLTLLSEKTGAERVYRVSAGPLSKSKPKISARPAA